MGEASKRSFGFEMLFENGFQNLHFKDTISKDPMTIPLILVSLRSNERYTNLLAIHTNVREVYAEVMEVQTKNMKIHIKVIEIQKKK